MSKSQPSTHNGPGGLGYVLAVVFGFGAVIVGLSAWRQQLAHNQPRQPASEQHAKAHHRLSASEAISDTQIDAVNPGMTLKQVLAVLGSGHEVSQTKTDAHTYTIYSWGDSLEGPSVSVTFIDGIASEVNSTPKPSN